MCGLTGWIMPLGSKWRPNKELIGYWLKSIESRGKDATGYWTYVDDQPMPRFWMKGAKIASDFVKEDLVEADVPVGRIGLMHTRSWTVGSPIFNENNHPLVVENTVVTHNGGFSDHKAVYKKLGIDKPIAEVDSAVVPHALQMLGYKEGLRVIEEETPGLAAIVAVMPNLDIVFAKDGRPLYMARLPEGGLMWSSEAEVCFAMQEWGGGKGFVASRFPALKWMAFDGYTLAKKDEGMFSLKLPPMRNAAHTSGMGFTNNRAAVQTYGKSGAPLCVWGLCTEVGTKTAMDTDGKPKMLCKPHKRQWKSGQAIPAA